MVYTNLEKAFDYVPREEIWWALNREGVPGIEDFAITEMYNNIKTSVKIHGK